MREVVDHITIILITSASACCVSRCFGSGLLLYIMYQVFLFLKKLFSSVDRNKKVNGRRNCQFEITLFVH